MHRKKTNRRKREREFLRQTTTRALVVSDVVESTYLSRSSSPSPVGPSPSPSPSI